LRAEFPGAHGDALSARLDLPAGPPRAWALFAHCFTCSKDFVASARVSRALAARGFAVLRFDFTGLGSSAGDFANTTFSSNVEDLVRAADFLRREHRAPALLVGHSLGGAAVLAAAARIPESVAVATIGAPAEPAHLKGLFAANEREIESAGEAEVELAGRRFRIRRELLRDLEATQLAGSVAALRKALLVLHAPFDAVVGIENASRIFQAAKHPKSFVSLDRADHLLSKPEDAAYVGEVLAAWASRFLPEPTGATAAGRAAPEPQDQEEVVVAESGDGPFGQVVRVGRHTLVADEPASAGGQDGGPTPYGLLLAALGTCTSMTLRMYARRKELPLDRVTVRLRHERIHARDCEDCETKDGHIDRIERGVELQGDLGPEQRQRLLEIADRCPVHRTLESEVSIKTRLVG
jgi:putative redox protein